MERLICRIGCSINDNGLSHISAVLSHVSVDRKPLFIARLYPSMSYRGGGKASTTTASRYRHAVGKPGKREVMRTRDVYHCDRRHAGRTSHGATLLVILCNGNARGNT